VEDGALADATVALLADDAARKAAGDAALGTFADHHAPLPATVGLVGLYEQMAATNARRRAAA
jgi:hypothetical protein